ncbi:hypothetical protein HO133_005211 [Letharia lupina]|uniref:Uncharacterized protein n=1 Tax=Letharia lupina TaxID=560253 RepID=A0A8H6C9J0_9LECA|nr:uncharacterized protein HO133_005211 [Letharia lupina]KAF6219385.1 hypothetical protein HO133_005211 [Letharia lupina]
MTFNISTIVNGTVYSMKITQEGKIYTIDRQSAKTYDVPIPAGYNGHMVLVLGRVPSQPGLRSQLTQIMSSVDPNVDWRDYLPIRPSKKNRRTGIQLYLRSSADRWVEMDLRSYARFDTECTIPLQILKKTPEEGLQFELSSKSRRSVQHYLNGRPTQAALEQPQPNK